MTRMMFVFVRFMMERLQAVCVCTQIMALRSVHHHASRWRLLAEKCWSDSLRTRYTVAEAGKLRSLQVGMSSNCIVYKLMSLQNVCPICNFVWQIVHMPILHLGWHWLTFCMQLFIYLLFIYLS